MTPDDGADDAAAGPSASYGVPIPTDHVGAFVAEVFEDAERSTDWEALIDRVIDPEARDAWAALSPQEQAEELLDMAAGFDRRAIDVLEGVPVDDPADGAAVAEDFAEAKRLRRNADAIRDGIAAAYGEGILDDEDLVGAVEAAGFDTTRIAVREDRLETVADVYDLSFRPYGGTLVQPGDRETADPGASETW